jgi:hypothetical protein
MTTKLNDDELNPEINLSKKIKDFSFNSTIDKIINFSFIKKPKRLRKFKRNDGQMKFENFTEIFSNLFSCLDNISENSVSINNFKNEFIKFIVKYLLDNINSNDDLIKIKNYLNSNDLMKNLSNNNILYELLNQLLMNPNKKIRISQPTNDVFNNFKIQNQLKNMNDLLIYFNSMNYFYNLLQSNKSSLANISNFPYLGAEFNNLK